MRSPTLALLALSGVAAGPCRYSFRLKECQPAETCAHQPGWLRPWRCKQVAPPPAVRVYDLLSLDRLHDWVLGLVALSTVLSVLASLLAGSATKPTLARTIYRLLVNRGRRFKGELSGLRFPVRVETITGRNGPAELTTLLQHGGHLPPGVSVVAVRDTGALITDGVKGSKAIVEVEYDGECALPRAFFVKANLPALSPMRLLCDTSEVSKCEARFYHHLAERVAHVLPAPKCYFCDYCEATSEFLLVSEVVRFGTGGILALKHRIRDSVTLEEQRAFVAAGGALNAQLWGDACGPELPRFDETHRRMWVLVQLIGRLGLAHTARRTLKGRVGANEGFMTWEAPAGLLGCETELIRDMPNILRSLCAERGMVAYGHNDLTLDNAYFWRGWLPKQSLRFGVFDWQQACVNNVGQEAAWNLHFLPPEFLTKHEDELIDLLLETYRRHGRVVSKAAFLRCYVLGTVQMYVFGGGGLQALMADLNKRGIFSSLVPNDARCRDGSLRGEVLEKVVGAEMTRRTFTNCCNIMRRHDFVGHWRKWQLSATPY